MKYIQLLRNKNLLLITSIILLGVLTQNLVLFRGGMRGADGFKFPSMHDTMWNIALTAELSRSFPPQHPGFSGNTLKNNHYFYPLLLAVVHKLTGISIIDLYFRIGPIAVSLIYGISLYAVSTLFTKSLIFRSLTVFLGYFSGSFAYLLPIFFGKNFNWQGNTFLSDQPFDQIINPYSVLGFSLMLLTVYFSSKVLDKKGKLDFRHVFYLVVTAGVTYGFKSFGGIILIGSLLLSTIVIFPKQKNLVLTLFPAFLIFLPVFFLISNFDNPGIKFAPGWVLTEMMVKQDGLSLGNFAQIENYYRSIGNTLGFIKIKAYELLIYLIGNLGVRMMGLAMLIMLLMSNKMRIKLPLFTVLIITFCVLISLVIPLLFNLGANAHNIVQFTPYSLVLLSVLTVVFLEKVYNFLAKNNKKTLGIIIILTLTVLSLPVNIKNIITKLENPNGTVSYAEYAGLTYLKNSSKTDSVVLIDPRQYEQDPIYVSALSQRRIYLASPDYARQTNIDPSKRLTSVYEYLDSDKNYPDSLSGKIDYIYLHLPVNEGFIYKAQTDGFKKQYMNRQVIILAKD